MIPQRNHSRNVIINFDNKHFAKMNFDTVEIGLYNMNEWLRKKNLKFGLIAGGDSETPEQRSRNKLL